jgi:hypothetical protein
MAPDWGDVWSNRHMLIAIIWRGIMSDPKGVERATQVVDKDSSWNFDDDISIPLGGFDDILNRNWLVYL